MGSDAVARGDDDVAGVSIHAPAWGATGCSISGLLRQGVSIHAPAWGATTEGCAAAHRPRFQFTLPHGERRTGGVQSSVVNSFNSRSRMGSDTIILPVACPGHSFNSRSRMGSDWPILASRRCLIRFQFTLPHGERLHQILIAVPFVVFQFTLPHGERQDPMHYEQLIRTVSIHAPAWGATERVAPRLDRPAVSIHAPAWGATCSTKDLLKPRLVSIHAPAWGATCDVSWKPLSTTVSIHAPAWGATGSAEAPGQTLLVSIHAPAWGATSPPPAPPSPSAVSIHAPAWGATRRTRRASRSSGRFNSRSRMGSDRHGGAP